VELPYEYRCGHCRLIEEVLIQVPADSGEGPSWRQQFTAEAALAFRRCPQCSRRDWASVILRLGGILLVAHLGIGATVFVLGVAGRSLQGLPEIVNRGPVAIALAWVAGVVLTIAFTLSEWSSAGISKRR
jgi:hypothetical protein